MFSKLFLASRSATRLRQTPPCPSVRNCPIAGAGSGFISLPFQNFELDLAFDLGASRSEDHPYGLCNPALLADHLPHVLLGHPQLNHCCPLSIDFFHFYRIWIVNNSLYNCRHQVLHHCPSPLERPHSGLYSIHSSMRASAKLLLFLPRQQRPSRLRKTSGTAVLFPNHTRHGLGSCHDELLIDAYTQSFEGCEKLVRLK